VAAGGIVVVTGASTGIGRATALHLDTLGFDVIAGVRRDADAEALRTAASSRLVTAPLDVTDAAAIATLAEQVAARAGTAGIAGLVNNAGIAVAGPLELLALDDLRMQLEVNVIAVVAMVQALAEPLRAARGRIVNIGSIGGRVSLPFVGPYAASKYAVEAISDALRGELAPWGIDVALIEPGSIATEIWAKGEAGAQEAIAQLSPRGHELYDRQLTAVRKMSAKTGSRGIKPERVAKVVGNALTARRPRTRYVVGPDAHAQLALKRLLPDRLLDRALARALGI
jgi:NAD(P)-dependent dehydrogenase (short-subunit alcohol dehydrogenase family)